MGPRLGPGPTAQGQGGGPVDTYLVWLQLLADGLDGVPTLAEHGLKQALLGFFAFGLRAAE